MLSLKTLHVFCAYATGLGFVLRGVLSLVQSPLRQRRLTKTLPHIIDSCLLISGVVLFYNWSVSLSTQPWLLAKLMALLCYIALGLLMLRWGKTTARRWTGLVGGLLVYLYIVGAAHSKSVLSVVTFF